MIRRHVDIDDIPAVLNAISYSRGRRQRRILDSITPAADMAGIRRARRARRRQLVRTTRRRRTYTPDEERRWAIAESHNKDPRYCWSDLVDWAFWGPGVPDNDGPDEHQLGYARGIRPCQQFAAMCGACYCGKVKNMEIWERGVREVRASLRQCWPTAAPEATQ
jgi:hypothetical protein